MNNIIASKYVLSWTFTLLGKLTKWFAYQLDTRYYGCNNFVSTGQQLAA